MDEILRGASLKTLTRATAAFSEAFEPERRTLRRCTRATEMKGSGSNAPRDARIPDGPLPGIIDASRGRM